MKGAIATEVKLKLSVRGGEEKLQPVLSNGKIYVSHSHI